jgi:hypothetical protein
MATEYVRNVRQLGHVDRSGPEPQDVPWGKTTEQGLTFTPGTVQREYLYTGQDLGPVDSQVTRVEGTTVAYRMAQSDPLTMARTLGLPETAVTGAGDNASRKVKQAELGMREFELYAIVGTSTGERRLSIPRAVVTGTDELNFGKGQWANPGCTMTLLQADGVEEFWAWEPEVAPEPEV